MGARGFCPQPGERAGRMASTARAGRSSADRPILTAGVRNGPVQPGHASGSLLSLLIQGATWVSRKIGSQDADVTAAIA